LTDERPDHDPLRDVIEVLERYAVTGARTLAVVHTRGWIRSGSLRRSSHVRLCAAGPRQDRGYPSASVESAAPIVGRGNCVRLCLSATSVADQEQAAHNARMPGRQLLTNRGRRAVRCLDANRRTSCGRQPAIRPTADGSWGWSGARTGEARNVPDHAFRRHMTAIVPPVAGGGALGQPPEKQAAQLPTCASYSPIGLETL
jgi:hypothetical protein